MTSCANSITGCTNMITQRGSMLCDSCISQRKSLFQTRKDAELEELLAKNHAMEKELMHIRKQLESLIKEKESVDPERIKFLEENIESLKMEVEKKNHEKANLEDVVNILNEENRLLKDCEHDVNVKYTTLEKEIEKEKDRYTQVCKENALMTDLVNKLRKEVENANIEKNRYEMPYEQLRLDKKTLEIEMTRLIFMVESLEKENKLLSEELALSQVEGNPIVPIITKPVPETKIIPEKVPPTSDQLFVGDIAEDDPNYPDIQPTYFPKKNTSNPPVVKKPEVVVPTVSTVPVKPKEKKTNSEPPTPLPPKPILKTRNSLTSQPKKLSIPQTAVRKQDSDPQDLFLNQVDITKLRKNK